jgi:signal transduction histidine kinase
MTPFQNEPDLLIIAAAAAAVDRWAWSNAMRLRSGWRLEQETLRPHVETIVRSGQALLRLLNDALDLSRAEAGRLKHQEDSFRQSSLVEDIDALARPRAAEAGLTDAVRIKQVLNNLVGNAIKFTDKGAEAYLAQGMDAVVEEPIRPEALRAAMARALEIGRKRAAAA